MLHAIDGLVEVAKEAVDVSKLPVSSGRRLRVVIVSEILLIYNTWNTWYQDLHCLCWGVQLTLGWPRLAVITSLFSKQTWEDK